MSAKALPKTNAMRLLSHRYEKEISYLLPRIRC